jgi:hypothetical protein
MYIINHFLDINVLGSGVLVPDKGSAGITNAATGTGSIGAQANLCTQQRGAKPNFVLVDYFDIGEWQELLKQDNYLLIYCRGRLYGTEHPEWIMNLGRLN